MLLNLLVACATNPDAEPSLPEIQREAANPIHAEHMKEHFDDAAIAIEAWLSGELPTAREHLEQLAEHQAPAGMVRGTDADLKAMQDAARKAAQAGPPQTMATHLAEIGVACGACHLHSKVKPTLAVPPPPPASDKVTPHMAGHLWAVHTMWAAMVTNDDAVWAKGTKAFDTEPVHGFEDEQQQQAIAVHAAGRKAASAKTPEARAKAFAEVATTCIGCHSSTRGE